MQLAAEFAVRFEAPHVINARTQVWAGAIGAGPDRQSLSATFEQSKRPAFQACLHLYLDYWKYSAAHSLPNRLESYQISNILLHAPEDMTSASMLTGQPGRKHGGDCACGP